jgi:hypothetical protein
MSYIRGRYYTWTNGKQTYAFGSFNETPNTVVDEFVVMRYAEMKPKTRVKAEKRAVKKYQGNIGCDALCKKYGKKTSMDLIEESMKK